MRAKQISLLTGGAIAAFGLGGWLYATPYITLYQMYAAAKENKPQQISRNVDFPAVRSSLKIELQEAFAEKVGGQQGGIASIIGAALGGFVLDPVLDNLVSPEGIASLLQGQEVDISNPNQSTEFNPQRSVDFDARYINFNTFQVSVNPKGQTRSTVDFILERRGLGWKLTGIDLPAF